MPTDSEFDPRYAPQFQRGFDPVRHAGAIVRDPVVAHHGPTRLAGGPATVAQRVPDPPPLAERPEPGDPRFAVASPSAERPSAERQHAEPPHAEQSAPALDADEAGLPVPRPRAEWALLITAAVLLALAGILIWGSLDVTRMYQGYGPGLGDQLYVVAIERLPGPLLVGGVLALCLWIVLRAVRLPKAAP